MYWDEDGWPRIVGGHGGLREVDAPRDAQPTPAPDLCHVRDDFTADCLDGEWNTLRVPFGPHMGCVGGGKLQLIGRGSLSNRLDTTLVARRWRHFAFTATTCLHFTPYSYQAMAGLANYYNAEHWSWIFLTCNDAGEKVLEVAECDHRAYRSFLQDNAVKVPQDAEKVWLRTVVDHLAYYYEYSFDGSRWQRVPVTLDAKVLSDDYVCSHYGGFFTGAFVGLAAVDYSGYGSTATFDFFEYQA